MIQEAQFIPSFDPGLSALFIRHPEHMSAVLLGFDASKGSDIGTPSKASQRIDTFAVNRACLDFDTAVLSSHDLHSAKTRPPMSGRRPEKDSLEYYPDCKK